MPEWGGEGRAHTNPGGDGHGPLRIRLRHGRPRPEPPLRSSGPRPRPPACSAGSTSAAAARELAKAGKRVLAIFLSGGVSQLETWDPKPNTDTGGPFQAIPTSVPGIHICELLPHTAKQMHRLALVRGLNTAEDDHGRGATIMLTGRKPEPGIEYPHLGAVAAKLLGNGDDGAAGPHPDHAERRRRFGKAGRRVPRAASTPRWRSATASRRPTCSAPRTSPPRPTRHARPSAEAQRPVRAVAAVGRDRGLRRVVRPGRAQVMQQATCSTSTRKTRSSPTATAGTTSAGTCCSPAGCSKPASPSSRCTHSNYDTHHENFDFHIEQLGEFDRPFAALLDDLADRGMLDSTLVVVMSRVRPDAEHQPTCTAATTGRRRGRWRWPAAGIKGGAVVGKTNANGTAVTDREVNGGHLFHTYLRAVGLDPTKSFYPNDRPVPIADPKASAIKECWRDVSPVPASGERGGGGEVSDLPGRRTATSQTPLPQPPSPKRRGGHPDQPLMTAPLHRPQTDPPRARPQAPQPAHRLPVRPVGPLPVRQRPGQHGPAVSTCVTGRKTALAGHRAGSAAWPSSPSTGRAAGRLTWARRPSASGPSRRPRPARRPFTLVTGDYHGKLDLVGRARPTSPTPVRTVEAHDGWCRAVAMSPDGKTVASCGNDHLVKLWAAADGKPVPRPRRARQPRLQRRLPPGRRAARVVRPQGRHQGLGPDDRARSSANWTRRCCTSTTPASGRTSAGPAG